MKPHSGMRELEFSFRARNFEKGFSITETSFSKRPLNQMNRRMNFAGEEDERNEMKEELNAPVLIPRLLLMMFTGEWMV